MSLPTFEVSALEAVDSEDAALNEDADHYTPHTPSPSEPNVISL